MPSHHQSASERRREDWMNSKWRPAMGWLYMTVCAFDFIIFPIMWAILQGVMHATQVKQWEPLTLQGAGLFHVAMGAVLGLAAWGRTQEKINGTAGGGSFSPTGFNNSGYNNPSGGFGAMQTNYNPQSNFNNGGFNTQPVGFGMNSMPGTAMASMSNNDGTDNSVSLSVSVNSRGQKVVPQFPDPAI